MIAMLPEVFAKKASTTKPMVHVGSITRVERSRDFPRKFLVCYTDGEKEFVFDYEAKIAREAAEIVVRIKHLMVLEAR